MGKLSLGAKCTFEFVGGNLHRILVDLRVRRQSANILLKMTKIPLPLMVFFARKLVRGKSAPKYVF